MVEVEGEVVLPLVDEALVDDALVMVMVVTMIVPIVPVTPIVIVIRDVASKKLVPGKNMLTTFSL